MSPATSDCSLANTACEPSGVIVSSSALPLPPSSVGPVETSSTALWSADALGASATVPPAISAVTRGQQRGQRPVVPRVIETSLSGLTLSSRNDGGRETSRERCQNETAPGPAGPGAVSVGARLQPRRAFMLRALMVVNRSDWPGSVWLGALSCS